jgi:hypothetical protein
MEDVMLTRVVCSVFLSAFFVASLQAIADDKSKEPKADPRAVNVGFTDGSHLKVLLAEDTVELQTPHGKLTFPITDIVKIDFAYRVPDEIALAIDKHITNLGDADFKIREQAMAALLEKKEKSYAALVRASRLTNDFEMRQRIEQLLEKLRQAIPEEQLNVRVHDYVYTADSRIAGKLTATNFKISSTQFGQLQLKLPDIRELRMQGVEPEVREDDPKNVLADPGNMKMYESEIGKSFAFRVTGNASFCYGTDVYTTDSPLSSAAVHMGLLKTGETAVLIATVLPSPPMFNASTRNGIQSSGWTSYPAAYTLRKPKTPLR